MPSKSRGFVMKIIQVLTDNLLKFDEISSMAALYGCEAARCSPCDALDEKKSAANVAASARIREQTTLISLPGGLVEHQSVLEVFYPQSGESASWTERVRGRLIEGAIPRPDAYDWDVSFVPVGSSLTLHELKSRGLKVSARQLSVGAWLRHWLHYENPVVWAHMPPTDRLDVWLAGQPMMQTPETAPTRAIVQSVHESGAWLKASKDRRAKHYWWPGLNAGIPMTPKKDHVHELTFLVHDIIHWAMPDVIPAGDGERHYRLYLLTRMMSEAITLCMADMGFVDQALRAGLDYDTSKRKIHPLFDPSVPMRQWCQAMSHYAIRGDASRLRAIAKSPEALDAFQMKYAPFFEADLRWTAHNARHLQESIDPRWRALHAQFQSELGLGFTSTIDYAQAWSDDDEALVDGVFGLMWDIHWGCGREERAGPSASPEARRLRRWWLGQLSLTFLMDDLPLSRTVRDIIAGSCLRQDEGQELVALIPLWENYVDALGGLSRLSSNDVDIFKAHFPVAPPFYVSYDLDPSRYAGVAATWASVRSLDALSGGH
jgi:hypothetical protein